MLHRKKEVALTRSLGAIRSHSTKRLATFLFTAPNKYDARIGSTEYLRFPVKDIRRELDYTPGELANKCQQLTDAGIISSFDVGDRRTLSIYF